MNIKKEDFGEHEGAPVHKYTLENEQGMSVSVITFGAMLVSCQVPDKEGKKEEVCLHYNSLEEIQESIKEETWPYYGSTCGRVANRTADGKFSVDGEEYTLAVNNGPNALHGGIVGFDKKVWTAEEVESPSGRARGGEVKGVKFTCVSADGEEGYPGTLTVGLTVLLDTDNQLQFVYEASIAGKASPVNLTNHTYWNLSGNFKRTVKEQLLRLHCARYTPVNDVQIPTGEIAPVEGTPFDFTTLGPIGPHLEQIDGGGEPGVDHNFVCDRTSTMTKETLLVVAHMVDEVSGRAMTVATTEPGVQVYSGNWLPKAEDEDSKAPHIQHNALCLECQHFPNAINMPEFDEFGGSVLLKPGDKYHQHTVHRFTVAA